MSHELSLRQKAIRWKQAGRAVSWICQGLERSREWFYKWWNRYQLDGASGLRDRSHTPQTNHHRWSSEIRQAILDIRDRLMRRRGPRERYRLAAHQRSVTNWLAWATTLCHPCARSNVFCRKAIGPRLRFDPHHVPARGPILRCAQRTAISDIRWI